jgi:site-specific DNA-methyltransferase (adenine-specific)
MDIETENVKLMFGDCLERMKEIPSESVDAIICDPPYGTTACKWDSIIPLEPMWEQLKRIIKPNGAIVMTASQPFTSVLICSNVKMFKYNWVWNKKTAANAMIAKYQPLKIYEDVCVFGGVYKPQMTKGKMRMKGGKNKSSGESVGCVKPMYHASDMYHPKSILEFKGERGSHPTQKPVALMEYLIKTYTNESDTVLDFTMGSGSTGVACVNTGRKFIGIELDPTYYGIACDRVLSQ